MPPHIKSSRHPRTCTCLRATPEKCHTLLHTVAMRGTDQVDNHEGKDSYVTAQTEADPLISFPSPSAPHCQ
eukprot:1137999-Pelagomonas_calceolata.AAC.3